MSFGVICCSVKTFIWTNVLWGTLSLTILVVSLVGFFIQSGVFVVVPEPGYFIFMGIGLFGLLVVFMGLFGQSQKVEICFLLYILLISLGLIVQTLAFTYALLDVYEISTIAAVDNAAASAQADFEKFLLDYAKDNAEEWRNTQNQFDCCGVDFEAGVGLAGNDLDILESGDRCTDDNDEVTELTTLRAQALIDPEFDPEEDVFQPALDSDFIGAGTRFFCKEAISSFVKDNAPIIVSILVLFLLVQVSALVAAARMYWVPDVEGGWQYDYEDNDKKNLKAPKTAEEFGGGFKGNVQAALGRLSYRFQNATTPDPDAPPTASYLQRLSMRRPVTNNGLGFGSPPPFDMKFGGHESDGAAPFATPVPRGPPGGPPPGGFGGPPGGPMGGPPRPPGLLNRLSKRLNPFGNFGPRPPMFGGGPGGPPPGPPGGPPGAPPFGGPGGPPGAPSFGGPGGPPGAPSFGGPGGPPGAPPFGAPGGGPPGGPPGGFAPPPRPFMGMGNMAKRMSARLMGGLQRVAGRPPGPPPGGLPAPNAGLPGPNAGLSAPPARPSAPPLGNSNRPSQGGAPRPGPPPPRASAPPPARATAGGKKKTTVAAGGGGRSAPPPAAAGRGGLLAQIQQGARLKHTQTNDRSAPMI